MNQVIKLCFVCYLILKTSFVLAVISQEVAYKALRNFDINFLVNRVKMDRSRGTCDENKSITEYLELLRKKDTGKIKPLNFSEATLGEVILNFYRIIQCKVDSRGEKYKTNFIGEIHSIVTTEIEKGIDPYFTEIIVDKRQYHFCLHYNGGGDQPGNCCLRQIDEKPQPWFRSDDRDPECIVYNSLLNDDEHRVLQNLLLCLEVARRKIADPNRFIEFEVGDDASPEGPDFDDVFFDLPILGAIVVGLELMNDQIIDPNDFFLGECCCFSGDAREENIKNLLLIFCQYKNFQTVEQFLETVGKLYEQFIAQKVTDQVLYLLEDENFGLPQKCRNLGGITQPKGRAEAYSYVREEVAMHDAHIVDVTNDENNFFYAVLQALNPNNRYLNVIRGDRSWLAAENLKKSLYNVKVIFPLNKGRWTFLNGRLGYDIIVLDATSFDDNFVKTIYNPQGFCGLDYLRNLQQAIILLWRGDRWQAVLPNSKA